MRKITDFKFPLALALLAAGNAGAATISVSIGPPGTQTTAIIGALVETFDSVTLGSHTTNLATVLGTYELTPASSFVVQNADQFGGASGTRFAAFGAQSGTSSPVTLALNSSYNYFGFWWSAIDAQNGVSFFDGNVLIARISAANIIALLSGPTIVASDGNTYTTSQYFGNPNTGQNTGEPYPFVNFQVSGGTFNRVVFDNSASTGTGFEFDNVSVHLFPAEVPEPSTFGLMLIGALALLFGSIRRQTRKSS